MIPAPHPMASFKEIDAWLLDRGWVQDGRDCWRLYRGRRLTIATHEEAVRMQRRRDAAGKRKP